MGHVGRNTVLKSNRLPLIPHCRSLRESFASHTSTDWWITPSAIPRHYRTQALAPFLTGWKLGNSRDQRLARCSSVWKQMSTGTQIDPNGDRAFYDRLLGGKRVNQRANFTAEALRGKSCSITQILGHSRWSGPVGVPLICSRHNQRITHC